MCQLHWFLFSFLIGFYCRYIGNLITLLFYPGASRDIELEAVSSIDWTIDDTAILSEAPTMLTLLRKVDQTKAISLCQHKGTTYIGSSQGGVVKIARNSQAYTTVIDCAEPVKAVSIHDDKIYAFLRDSKNDLVRVYKLSGEHITEWSLASSDRCFCDIMAITSDQVVIPDKTNKRITAYSLTGSLIKSIPCSVLGNKHTAMCLADSKSVIISDKDLCQVSRVNLSSGQVMWICREVGKPLGVTCYGRNYVLVASCSTRRISVLDVKTGKVAGELADPALNNGNLIFSLVCTSNTLIVAGLDVLFYQLNV